MKEIIKTEKAPAAIGPYSQAIRWNQWIFVSGQLSINEKTGAVEGDIKTQTRQVLTNLRNILEASGSGMEWVLKTTVFLADMNDFGAMNEVYASFFPQNPPARSTIQVARLPKDARVEIEAIALRRP
jgi:2-iminobutanoate/2-iminopropanoate deaminase